MGAEEWLDVAPGVLVGAKRVLSAKMTEVLRRNKIYGVGQVVGVASSPAYATGGWVR